MRGSDHARLSGNVIRNNDNGMNIDDSDDLIMSGDRIIDNSGIGIWADENKYGVILSADPNTPTAIFGNTGTQVYMGIFSFKGSFDIYGPGNIDARNVWWGTTDLGLINDGIIDYTDASHRGIVFCEPWATIPEPATLALLSAGFLVVFRRRRC